MKKNTLKKRLFGLFFILFVAIDAKKEVEKTPRVTVVFVVDQLAYFYLPRLNNYFKYGLKVLMEQGVNYTNAYFPHAMPSTATGHAGLNTGAYAKDHGIIGNGWYNEKGEYIHCDDDFRAGNEVFSDVQETYAYGKSSYNLMAHGISDTFIASSLKNRPRHVYSVSLKGRAAILTAGKQGKALWFDNNNGKFTTSKAYFQSLPKWFSDFNEQQTYREDASIIWKSIYPRCHKAYSSVKDLTYGYARYDFKLINKNIAPKVLEISKGQKEVERKYDLWVKTPFANQAVLDLGRAAFDQHISRENKDEILLWVCLSSLDKLGHFYGPNSQEVVDMIYHLDRQIGEFMKYVQAAIGREKALFVLTSDHGIMPFVEVLKDNGHKCASRVSAGDLQSEINLMFKKKHGIKKVLPYFKIPQFYVDRKALNQLNAQKKSEVLNDIKKQFLSYPEVKNVWTIDELSKACFEPQQIENYYKMQLYPGRSGEIIVQSSPDTFLTGATKGTSHKNPYEDNTHVPLILYQPYVIEKAKIVEKVWALQLPNTLAEILKIPQPSASRFEVLPGIFNKKSH